MNARAPIVLLALVAVLALAAAGCGSTSGRGDAGGSGENAGTDTGTQLTYQVVADESRNPGHDELAGGIARDPADVAALWDAAGLTSPPPESGRALIVVAGGESSTCPWELDRVTADSDAGAVTVRLVELRQERTCTADWNPRTLALTAAAEEVPADAELRLVDQFGDETTLTPIR